MPFTIRKRKKIGPGLWLNFGKRGANVSVGKGPIRYTFGGRKKALSPKLSAKDERLQRLVQVAQDARKHAGDEDVTEPQQAYLSRLMNELNDGKHDERVGEIIAAFGGKFDGPEVTFPDMSKGIVSALLTELERIQ